MEPKSRTPLYLAGGLALVITLAVAAFLAGRLLNQQIAGTSDPQILPGPNGGQVVAMEIKIKPAPELPQTDPEINGVFTKRDDNRIYLGTFSGNGMGVAFSSSTDSGSTTNSDSIPYDGPVVEVVIAKETIIYRETTQFDPEQSSSEEIQQTVGPGSLDDLSKDSMVTVWGRRTGDRVVADIVLYTQPMMIELPEK